MDNDYLRQRTDQILRERIRLGMTGGDGDCGGEYADEGYQALGYEGGVKQMGETHKKLRAYVMRALKNPPDTPTRVKNFEKKKRQLCVYLRRRREKGTLTASDKKLLALIGDCKGVRKNPKKKPAPKRKVVAKKKSTQPKNKKGKDCSKLKTHYRRGVCRMQARHPKDSYNDAARRVSGLKRYRKKAKVPCANMQNPWLQSLCDYRAMHGNERQYQGQQGNRQLMRDAAIEYRLGDLT